MSVFTRSYPDPDQQTLQQTNVATRNPTPDSLNLNRYYRTELLTASEEYSLGMKVKFVVKCEAVHEGLAIHIGQNPTIAEWAKACGFEDYDAEISSENYRDSELDKQIRPAGSDTPELDPNMFVGIGLVNDRGVGWGKGWVKNVSDLSSHARNHDNPSVHGTVGVGPSGAWDHDHPSSFLCLGP
jgi:hypothetical protein